MVRALAGERSGGSSCRSAGWPASEKNLSRLVRLARDAVANVGLDDVDRLSAIGSPCWSSAGED
jgi:hypothetical protein